jgi:hypothetical protein
MPWKDDQNSVSFVFLLFPLQDLYSLHTYIRTTRATEASHHESAAKTTMETTGSGIGTRGRTRQ